MCGEGFDFHGVGGCEPRFGDAGEEDELVAIFEGQGIAEQEAWIARRKASLGLWKNSR